MKITRITAAPDQILLTLDAACDAAVHVSVCVPLICADPAAEFTPGRTVFEWHGVPADGVISLPRYAEQYDMLICRFDAASAGVKVPGVCYVTDFADGFSQYNYPLPEIKRPIGTWCNAAEEDIDYMRFGYMMDELDQVWLMTIHPKEDDIPYEWNGNTYWFSRKIVEEHDAYHRALAKRGIPVLLRFINRLNYHLRSAETDLFEMIRHPGYETDFDGVEMSAVNLRTETGLNYYCACLDFLFSRYASPDSPYGWSMIMDIGNEINSQRVWHNAGPMSCEAFMEEYTCALRLAWLLSHKYYAHYQVHISLEYNFNKIHVPLPEQYYSGRECLEQLQKNCLRDGDFDWGVSSHPYPENLSYPDFWNDRAPTFSFDTPIITMKNMEVWPAFLAQSEFRYRGEPRHVLFDEQGFNTRPDAPYTEEQGAYAFVLAWLKIRKNPQIDYFLIHRYIDIPFNQEYGLNLGLRRCLGYADEEHLINIPGPRKMICQAIAAMDTPEEDAWIRAARAYIGPDLFDAILNPPPIDPGRRAKKKEVNFDA